MATVRKTVFVNSHYYHVFNRGVERRTVFLNKREYRRFLDTFIFYRLDQSALLRYSRVQLLNKETKYDFEQKLVFCPPRVSILSYCLMPNHFHLLLRQDKENGISSFMADITNSYTKYFNTKHKRIGSLFQGPFQAVHIESEEQLIHLSRYIHINPFVSSVVELNQISSYPYSSLGSYLGMEKQPWLVSQIVLSHFAETNSYKQFVVDQISYGTELEKIKHLVLEE
jgi:putative transposase